MIQGAFLRCACLAWYYAYMNDVSNEEIAPVQWVSDPTPSRGERTKRFRQLAEQLKERPGQWALAESGLNSYRTQAAVMATRINKGELTTFRPRGSWQAKTSKDELYIRYVGVDGEFREEQPASAE